MKRPTAAQAGRKGGEARAARMTPAQRSESARHAALTRWQRRYDAVAAKLRANAASTYETLTDEVCANATGTGRERR